ncbi:MAG: Uma2 family endonuclease [Aphanothece sp. CMT-3BRIN-NPC111]|jgi:Uma2 family endonuclease|nr:Uma2 family endonuclease [Aphanothece sp. CMT-3BRIN-NPC111]
MVQKYNPWDCLPTSAELPDSDDTPVDNELQNLIPNLLSGILALAWSDRMDWFFGVDMGIYHTLGEPPLVPDGFLSLGVERFIGEEGRLSYVLWEEDNVVPLLALEVVSKTYNGEYEQKKITYAQLGILYYVIYAPGRGKRRKRSPFEVYRLVDGQYVQQLSDPVWMPEINLGIGRGQGTYQGWMREWLYWYDQEGNRLPTPEEVAQREVERASMAEQRAEQERQRAERLLAQLREMGIDPNTL